MSALSYDQQQLTIQKQRLADADRRNYLNKNEQEQNHLYLVLKWFDDIGVSVTVELSRVSYDTFLEYYIAGVFRNYQYNEDYALLSFTIIEINPNESNS